MVSTKVDFHVHSSASYDCESSLDEILETCDRKGLDFIGLTDHNSVSNIDTALDMADSYNVDIIPGIEVSSKHGHIIGLGVTEEIEKNLSYSETVDRIRSLEGFVLVPHPFQVLRHGVSKSKILSSKPDCIEAFNSRYFTGLRNIQSRKFAKASNIPGIACSDSHRVEDIGKGHIKVSGGFKDYREIFDAVRSHKFERYEESTSRVNFLKQIRLNVGKKF